mmetsp:Transcript_23182/g.36890  ORF Transcript_23182/g.36890 Transcript_23182/m.36890 type:complete len:524 (-) Transcript_23182:1037-2608(-)
MLSLNGIFLGALLVTLFASETRPADTSTDYCDSSEYTIGQVRLAIGQGPSQVFAHFTVIQQREQQRGCALQTKFHVAFSGEQNYYKSEASLIGCFNTGFGYTWHYLVARLDDAIVGAKYTYEILGGTNTYRGVFSLNTSLPVVVIGDTGEHRKNRLVDSLLQENPGLAIHVGDMSYASNSGTCWSVELQEQRRCAYDCTEDEECEGRDRQSKRALEDWEAFFRDLQPLLATVPVMATMGNHDNDLQWFFKFRPPVGASAPNVSPGLEYESTIAKFHSQLKGAPASVQQAALNVLLNQPFFYSFDHGLIHFVSIQTEDNGINAYERSTKHSLRYQHGLGVLSSSNRFDAHFGINSPQYRWLVDDLSNVDRLKTPFVIVFTHRPMFHSSTHHPNCGVGGDWYGCTMRNTYAPLFEKYGVNLVLAGHSHHYSRSKPIAVAEDGAIQVREPGLNNGRDHPIYLVVGTSGFKLEKHFSSTFPHWLAYRTGEHFGYLTLLPHNNTHMTIKFISTTEQRVIDSVTIEEYN